MQAHGFNATPSRSLYDVVIIGGAIMGASAAWFLSQDPGFKGSVLVVERDPTYARCSTALSNSCIRQQFSTELNVRISQFGADFFQNLRARMGGDERVPEMSIQSFGYLYLANSRAFAEILRQNRKVQAAAGASTRLLSADEIAREYPFYHLDDIVLGSINRVDEGYFDGWTMFEWFRRKSRESGVEYVTGEVTGMTLDASRKRIENVVLAGEQTIACGQVVNASGPRAARIAAMAGIALPVEPRKRFTWVFRAEKPLDRELPLTIDPSGVHVRENGGGTYLAGGHGEIDLAADPEDFDFDHSLWENHVWPVLAMRIPQFEAIRVQSQWTGHYAYNVLDQNAVTGPHPEIGNFLFLNGFSGHGLQQSPAMGRGTAEWLVHGRYTTLDLSPFHYGRITANTPILERAVI